MPDEQGRGAIAIAQLAAKIDTRWRRKRLLSRIPDQPIIHLVRASTPDRLNDQLSAHLGSAVPHVRVQGDTPLAEGERARSIAIREVLDKAARDFVDHDARGHLGRFRFERYALLSWLLKQNLPPAELGEGPNSRTRELILEYIRGRLRGRKRARRDQTSQSNVDSVAARIGPLSPPWWATLIAYMVAWFVPKVVYGGPRIGVAQRWFMRRQHYLAPRGSADFASFAQRLITTPSVHESAQEVRKLLLHAFLEDLADGYARQPWRLRWIRRDNYPVMLLYGLTSGTVGADIVRLVNDVRNETGAADPLLIVATGPSELSMPEAGQTHEPTTLDDWPGTLLRARRRRSPTAWYAPVVVSDRETLADRSPDSAGVWAFPGRLELPPVRSWLYRYLPTMLVVVIVLVSGGGYWNWHARSCSLWWPWSGNDLYGADSGQCVGVAADGYVFSDDDDELADLQRRIVEQNREAENDQDEYVTVVFLGALSAHGNYSSTLAAAKEELRGIARAQWVSIYNTSVPMRVVLANAGQRMEHAEKAATSIVELAERDDSVVGVVGLGQSRKSTQDAMKVLGRAGLPMVGSVTSGDDMPDQSELYYQVAPSNRREAQVAVRYARDTWYSENSPHPPRMSVYFAHDDEYSSGLADDVAEELRRVGITPERVPFNGQGGLGYADPNEAGLDLCGRTDDPVFFAGRSESVNDFVQGITDGCAGAPPPVLASDDTIKFVLDNTINNHPKSSLTLHYVSFAERAKGRLRGRAVLSFDAMAVLRLGVGNLPDELRDPLAVWHGISQISGTDPYEGRSGTIDFGPAGNQVAVDKAVSIMKVVPNSEPQLVFRCGTLTKTERSYQNCPRDDPSGR